MNRFPERQETMVKLILTLEEFSKKNKVTVLLNQPPAKERKGQDKAKHNLRSLTKTVSFNQQDIKVYPYRMLFGYNNN